MRKLIQTAACLFLAAGLLPGSKTVLAAGDVAIPAADSSVAIDETTFPDSTFRTYVKNHFDLDGDGTLSDSEIAGATSIDFTNAYITDAASLQGIEYLTELSYLECQYNKLTSLDISNNTKLLDLRCDGNQLTSLDASANTNLQYLWCSENQLTSLDISAGGLLMLNCEKNQLTGIDVNANPSLVSLRCGDNQITALDIGNVRGLEELYCQNNEISTLDVSAQPGLVYLNCDNNRLSSVDVTQNPLLSALECCDNDLTSVDISRNPQLTNLRCASNRLSSIDFHSNKYMIGLDCSNNNIKSLDLSCTRGASDTSYPTPEDLSQMEGAELSVLYCAGNPLGKLDLSQQRKLTYLDCSNTGLTSLDLSVPDELISLNCSSNSLSSLDVSRQSALISLDCSSNNLGKLDLSRNKSLKTFSADGNTVRVPMTKSGKKWKFDLSDLMSDKEISDRVTITTKKAEISGNQAVITSSSMPTKLVYSYNTNSATGNKLLTVTVQPSAAKEICSHTGAYVVTKEATVFKTGKKKRTCPICGTVQTKTIKKLTPTIKLDASSIKLKVGKSTTVKVSGLAKGDSVKSWKSADTSLVKVTKKGKITAKKKTGKTKVTVTLASGLKKDITVKVKK